MRPLYLIVVSILYACGTGHQGPGPQPEQAAAGEAEGLQDRLRALRDELDATRTLLAGLEIQARRERAERGNLEIQASSLTLRQARLTRALSAAEGRLGALAQREARGRQDLEAALEARRTLEAERAARQERVRELESRLKAGTPRPEAVAAAKRRIVELHKAEQALIRRGTVAAEAREAALAATHRALTEAQLELARLTRARGVYTVQAGDRLYRIADFFYRDGGRWPVIVEANAPLIGRPERLRPGSVLVIPR